MEKKKIVYYQEEDMWIGWLEEYPDYRTQGKTLAELKDNLVDIFFLNGCRLIAGTMDDIRQMELTFLAPPGADCL